MITAKCNCGRDGRYMCLDGEGNQVMSCNKYKLCPTYEGLEKELKELKTKYNNILDTTLILESFKETTDLYQKAQQVLEKHRYERARTQLLR